MSKQNTVTLNQGQILAISRSERLHQDILLCLANNQFQTDKGLQLYLDLAYLEFSIHRNQPLSQDARIIWVNDLKRIVNLYPLMGLIWDTYKNMYDIDFQDFFQKEVIDKCQNNNLTNP